MDEPVPERDERVKLVASATGLLAQVEVGRVAVFELPDLSAVSEIGIPGDLDDHDVAFSGGRLVVLTRSGVDTVLHIIDPRGPAKLGETKFRGTARIVAHTEDHLLITTGSTASIVDVGKHEPLVHPLPLRGTISAAGTMNTGFIVCVAGVLEEWDAVLRKPARRLRVDQAIDPWQIGGNDRRVWIVPRKRPDQIDVVNLDKRSSRRIELPEPASRLVAHPAGNLMVVIGAGSGRAYLVDVSRQQDPVLPIDQVVIDLAWLGPGFTLAVRPVDAPIGLLSMPTGDDELTINDEPRVATAPPSPAPAPAREAPAPASPASASPAQPAPASPAPAAAAEDTPARWTREDIASRLAAWRERVGERRPQQAAAPDAEPHPAVTAVAEAEVRPAIAAAAAHPGGWRGEIAAWARAVCARSYREMPRLDHCLLDAIADRLALGEPFRAALALLYGAYLNGLPTVAPIELAPCVRWQWPEALGNGKLAASGAVRWRRGQIGLYPEVIAVLDERPPMCGSLVEGEGRIDNVVAVISSDASTAKLGPLFVRNARGERAPMRFALEAKLRGVAIVVIDAAEATRFGIELHS